MLLDFYRWVRNTIILGYLLMNVAIVYKDPNTILGWKLCSFVWCIILMRQPPLGFIVQKWIDFFIVRIIFFGIILMSEDTNDFESIFQVLIGCFSVVELFLFIK